jgi:hypothetical protein
VAVVEALGLPDPALWPSADDIDPHFCSYRVLARLAREGVFEQAVTLNYDCAYEAGLKGEGFLILAIVDDDGEQRLRSLAVEWEDT